MEQWQDRIERKIDQLSDAVVSLARMEERMITLFKRMDTYDERQADLGKRMAEVEKTLAKRGVVNTAIDRVLWIGATALITALVTGVL